MKLESLYQLTQEFPEIFGKTSNVSLTIYLSESKHESWQQEAYRFKNKTMKGYISKESFDIVIGDVTFTFIAT